MASTIIFALSVITILLITVCMSLTTELGSNKKQHEQEIYTLKDEVEDLKIRNGVLEEQREKMFDMFGDKANQPIAQVISSLKDESEALIDRLKNFKKQQYDKVKIKVNDEVALGMISDIVEEIGFPPIKMKFTPCTIVLFGEFVFVVPDEHEKGMDALPEMVKRHNLREVFLNKEKGILVSNEKTNHLTVEQAIMANDYLESDKFFPFDYELATK